MDLILLALDGLRTPLANFWLEDDVTLTSSGMSPSSAPFMLKVEMQVVNMDWNQVREYWYMTSMFANSDTTK